eukprot:gnl/MRDRNA2_/MRDRNA2_55702_c0_seq1.p1 gnl/MRDRNA2_/MRDRNA2_55702_c0~~gnl/MRDRNA2_/MRDRNA2_55702_c0_seq1.p1  ORF type:complete len:165 (-),score=24.62 gnl/MRDRNA2_/MRDRNA2_55702_c0_seq1:77-550(-)
MSDLYGGLLIWNCYIASLLFLAQAKHDDFRPNYHREAAVTAAIDQKGKTKFSAQVYPAQLIRSTKAMEQQAKHLSPANFAEVHENGENERKAIHHYGANFAANLESEDRQVHKVQILQALAINSLSAGYRLLIVIGVVVLLIIFICLKRAGVGSGPV